MMVIEKIWTTDTAIWIRTAEGREAYEDFSNYPPLKFATPEERNNFEADEFGIHWKDLDEDLSFEGFFKEKQSNFLYMLFMNYPELNASAIARRMGMKQSLLAAYISGAKKPSPKRQQEIISTIREIGKELQQIEWKYSI
ncbi:DUF2442 domain-containing protein [Limibacterium fermenti]|uniref:DUF2442 domain-containing protein n=1 Tax=Limibacterium fermenti TaxID=3229863 RepID=UPI003A6E4685